MLFARKQTESVVLPDIDGFEKEEKLPSQKSSSKSGSSKSKSSKKKSNCTEVSKSSFGTDSSYEDSEKEDQNQVIIKVEPVKIEESLFHPKPKVIFNSSDEDKESQSNDKTGEFTFKNKADDQDEYG